MPNQLMATLVEAEGYCCVYGYFAAKRDEGRTVYQTSVLAAHLGVGTRDIRWWKQQIREHQCVCEKLTCCKRHVGYTKVGLLPID